MLYLKKFSISYIIIIDPAMFKCPNVDPSGHQADWQENNGGGKEASLTEDPPVKGWNR
jgi:hypothetical protein